MNHFIQSYCCAMNYSYDLIIEQYLISEHFVPVHPNSYSIRDLQPKEYLYSSQVQPNQEIKDLHFKKGHENPTKPFQVSLNCHSSLENSMVAQNGAKENNIQKRTEFLVSRQNLVKHGIARKGHFKQTMELAINFKTLFVQYFRLMVRLHQLDQSQIIHLQKFAKRSPSLESIHQFFQRGGSRIKQRCLDFICSSHCIKRIMTGRCRMSNKLAMIKYLDKLRQTMKKGCVVKWKHNQNSSKKVA